MRRVIAGLLLTVLIGGPVAASVCDASCLDHGRGELELAAEPIAVSPHQHHHGAMAVEGLSHESGLSSPTSTVPGRPIACAADDCCLGRAWREPARVSSATPPAMTIAQLAVATGVCAGTPRASAMPAVAHALEPPADSIARHLSSILRI